jgi:hypothetical protein
MPSKRSSITRQGTSENVYLDVAKGLVEHHSHEEIFSFDPSVSSVESIIWSATGVVTIPPDAGSGIVFAISDSSADDVGSTGGTDIVVQGLDENFAKQEVTVAMNGTGAVAVTGTWSRINHAFIVSSGSGETNAGLITIGASVTAGAFQTLYSAIASSEGEASQALYTVPAGYTAYVIHEDASSFTNANGKALIRHQERKFGKPWRTRRKYIAGPTRADATGEIPTEVEAKSDIKLTSVLTGSGDVDVVSHLELLLIKE